MAVNGIEIEVGQVWRTRGGLETDIVRAMHRDGYRWVSSKATHLVDGRVCTSYPNGHPHDLVELISPAPAPAKERPVQFADANFVGVVRDDLADYEEAEAEKAKVDGLVAAHAEKFGASTRVSAIGILDSAANHMRDRAAIYDSPEGERSMGAAVTAFNAITKHTLTEAEGWLLLQVLKDVRLFQRAAFHQDSAEDCVAYAALKAEAKAKGGAQ